MTELSWGVLVLALEVPHPDDMYGKKCPLMSMGGRGGSSMHRPGNKDPHRRCTLQIILHFVVTKLDFVVAIQGPPNLLVTPTCVWLGWNVTIECIFKLVLVVM
jgi:hypothetical protein